MNNEVQDLALKTYLENIEYIKENDFDLFSKLVSFDELIDKNLYKPKYDLTYNNEGYFDIIEIETGNYVYNENSNKFSKLISENIHKNKFKTFFEFNYDSSVLEYIKTSSIYENVHCGIAPLREYLYKNFQTSDDISKYNMGKFIFFGIGLGQHLKFVEEKLDVKKSLIIEDNLEIFRLSLFVTNYTSLKNKDIVFSVGDTINQFRLKFYKFYDDKFIYNNYIRFLLLGNNYNNKMSEIQTILSLQNQYTYSYDRQFKNIKRSVELIENGYNFLKINNVKDNSTFSKQPFILVAAGPSLNKNIEWLKRNKDNFIIVSLLVTLPTLEKHNIIPDIVVHIDEFFEVPHNLIKSLDNLNVYDNTKFIFSQVVDPKIIGFFPKENISIVQVTFPNFNIGSLMLPSVGEWTVVLLLLLKVKELYLLGLDFALDYETGKSHVEEHHSFDTNSNKVNLSELKVDGINTVDLRNSLLEIKGNFREKVKTTPLFYDSMIQFNKYVGSLENNGFKIYNLNDGAYLEYTIPLRTDDFEKSFFSKFIDYKSKLNIFILNNSKSTFDDDLEIDKINENLENARFMINYIKKFLNKKIVEKEKFLYLLMELIEFSIKKSDNFSLHKLYYEFLKLNTPLIYLFFSDKSKIPKQKMNEVKKILSEQMINMAKEYIEEMEKLKKVSEKR